MTLTLMYVSFGDGVVEVTLLDTTAFCAQPLVLQCLFVGKPVIVWTPK
jgi:hypothetical protein